MVLVKNARKCRCLIRDFISFTSRSKEKNISLCTHTSSSKKSPGSSALSPFLTFFPNSALSRNLFLFFTDFLRCEVMYPFSQEMGMVKRSVLNYTNIYIERETCKIFLPGKHVVCSTRVIRDLLCWKCVRNQIFKCSLIIY